MGLRLLADVSRRDPDHALGADRRSDRGRDRKSTRLNSSHLVISYAVFCLKKKNNFATAGHYTPKSFQFRIELNTHATPTYSSHRPDGLVAISKKYPVPTRPSGTADRPFH